MTTRDKALTADQQIARAETIKAFADLPMPPVDAPALAMFSAVAMQKAMDGAEDGNILTGEVTLNYAQLETAFAKAGTASGDVERSGEELGVALFYSARAGLIDSTSCRPLYIKQRQAQASRVGQALDLADDKTSKAISSQSAKLNAFVHAAKHGKVTPAFMIAARHAARNLPKGDKTPSIYNALLTICRAQKDAKEEMTEPEMLALFVKDAKDDKTEIEKLEALLKACGKVGEAHPAADINATFALINKCILTRKAEYAAQALGEAKAAVAKAGVADGTAPLPAIIAKLEAIDRAEDEDVIDDALRATGRVMTADAARAQMGEPRH